MIKTKRDETLSECLPDIPRAALDFLLSVTEQTENGKRLFDDDCFVNVMSTETKTEIGLMEAHEKYIDVQCLISGEEKMLYTEKAALTQKKPYNESSDYALYAFDTAEEVILNAGDCVIFYPNEAHLPCLAPNGKATIKKAVLKLKCK